MGRPEPQQSLPHTDADDLDFAWDDSFPTRPPPRHSSAPEGLAAPSKPPPLPRSRSLNVPPSPSTPLLTPLPLGSSPAPVAIEDLPEPIETRPREMMITLTDEDPLRYDVGYSKDRDITRDSMPTIPDINPLRHDVAPDTESGPDRPPPSNQSGSRA